MTRRARETFSGQTATAQAASRRGGPLGSVLALQRMAGNRAVASLMRAPAGTGATAPRENVHTEVLITIRGHTQGTVKGTGADGAIAAWSFEMTVTSESGKAGKPEARPIKFKKSIDDASPQLLTALFNHETLDQVRIDILPAAKNATGGSRRPVETILLKNAEIVSFTQDSDEGSDTVGLAYESATFTHDRQSTSTSDKWKSK